MNVVPFVLMFKIFFIHYFQLCELFNIHYITCLGHLIGVF